MRVSVRQAPSSSGTVTVFVFNKKKNVNTVKATILSPINLYTANPIPDQNVLFV